MEAKVRIHENSLFTDDRTVLTGIGDTPPIFISSTKTPLKYDCLKQLISVLQIKLPKLQAICKLLIIYLFLVISYEQCDQIGRFLKVLGDIVAIKSSPNA